MSRNSTTDVEFDYLFKILIIGDSGVGKTSILQRFAHDQFSTDYLATIGVDFHIRTVDVDTSRCKLQVWDTAGQDRFKCVVSSFYRGAHGVMICFDITDMDSFRNVNNWHEEIIRYSPENTPIFLVGTKSDLQSKRTVSYPTIKAYADSKQLSYIETSSKANENIENCFLTITRMLVEHTHQKDMKHQNKTIELKFDSNNRTKPVINGGCMGGNNCTI